MLPGHDAITAGSQHNIPDSVGEWESATLSRDSRKAARFLLRRLLIQGALNIFRCSAFFVPNTKEIGQIHSLEHAALYCRQAAMTGNLRIGDELFLFSVCRLPNLLNYSYAEKKCQLIETASSAGQRLIRFFRRGA